MTSVLIVEDEKKTAEMLRTLIENQSDYLVVRICDSIEATTRFLANRQENLDLIFMDIQLADGESFEIFREIEVRVPVIFCTAYDDYLLKAFKTNGIEYLLKPCKEMDIQQALAKFQGLRSAFVGEGKSTNARVEPVIAARQRHQRTFLVHFREKMVPIAAQDVACVQLHEGITYLFNFKGEKYPIFKKIEEMESALDPEQFFRINRQMLVNREAIREIEPYFNRKVVLALDFALPEKAIVSRLKVTPFTEWLQGN
ncbi:MAG: LytTR family DNA-binding domain-containing protein [Bacteroidota bacterium]